MKITRQQLKHIIQEELRQVLFEQEYWPESNPDDPAASMESSPRSGSRENPIILPPETVTRSESPADTAEYSHADARVDSDASNEISPRRQRRIDRRQSIRDAADRGEIDLGGLSARQWNRQNRGWQPGQAAAPRPPGVYADVTPVTAPNPAVTPGTIARDEGPALGLGAPLGALSDEDRARADQLNTLTRERGAGSLRAARPGFRHSREHDYRVGAASTRIARRDPQLSNMLFRRQEAGLDDPWAVAANREEFTGGAVEADPLYRLRSPRSEPLRRRRRPRQSPNPNVQIHEMIDRLIDEIL